MVKKKQKVVNSKQFPVSSEQPMVTVDKPAYYDIGAWGGIPQYRCRFCKFDTLQSDVIEQHVKDVHLQIPSPAPAVNPTTTETDQVSTDGDLNGVFEIELEEISSTTDEQGNEHKKYTVKEN